MGIGMIVKMSLFLSCRMAALSVSMTFDMMMFVIFYC